MASTFTPRRCSSACAQIFGVLTRRADRRRPLRRPASTTRPNPAAAEAIFVVHRGLVHEVCEAVLAVRAAMAEEHERARRAGSPCVASSGATCTSSQSSVGARGPREHGVDHVERREIDDARVRACRRAHGLVLADDVAPRHRDDELAAAVGVACASDDS